MAEAQHKQALAGYWPQVSFKAAYQLLDQPVNLVIRAQLVEALMSAQHFKERFDYLALLSQLNLVIGREVRNSLKGGTK